MKWEEKHSFMNTGFFKHTVIMEITKILFSANKENPISFLLGSLCDI